MESPTHKTYMGDHVNMANEVIRDNQEHNCQVDDALDDPQLS